MAQYVLQPVEHNPWSGERAASEPSQLGPLIDRWFPSGETATLPDETPPPVGIEAPRFSLQPVGHDPFDNELYLAATRAKAVLERQMAAPPEQIG
jgi:hypothetical protein